MPCSARYFSAPTWCAPSAAPPPRMKTRFDMTSGDHARILQPPEIVPRAAVLEQHGFGVRPRLAGGAPHDGRLARELYRIRAEAHRALGGLGLEQVAVGDHLRVVNELRRRLVRSPDAFGSPQPGFPVVARPRPEVADELLADRARLVAACLGRRVA